MYMVEDGIQELLNYILWLIQGLLQSCGLALMHVAYQLVRSAFLMNE
jgi:hypothetical protein